MKDSYSLIIDNQNLEQQLDSTVTQVTPSPVKKIKNTKKPSQMLLSSCNSKSTIHNMLPAAATFKRISRL